MAWVLRSVEHTAINTVTAALVAIIIVAPLRAVLKKLGHRLGSVIDSLDPRVPVGVTRQLDFLEQEIRKISEKITQEEPMQVEIVDDEDQ